MHAGEHTCWQVGAMVRPYPAGGGCGSNDEGGSSSEDVAMGSEAETGDIPVACRKARQSVTGTVTSVKTTQALLERSTEGVW